MRSKAANARRIAAELDERVADNTVRPRRAWKERAAPPSVARAPRETRVGSARASPRPRTAFGIPGPSPSARRSALSRSEAGTTRRPVSRQRSWYANPSCASASASPGRARTSCSSSATVAAETPPAATESARSANAPRARCCRDRLTGLGEDAADEATEGERDRSRAAHQECRLCASRRRPRLPTCVPCARSRGSVRRRTGSSTGSPPRSSPRRRTRI